MPLELSKRIGVLFRSNDESSVELVMAANSIVAVALAALTWLKLGLPFPWAVAVVPAAFVLLTACLLFRYTLWIPAVLGSITIAISAGLLGASLMSGVSHGTWIGGAIGGLGGLAVAGWTYAHVGRMARRG